jgi:FkbM family methyltransferase
VVTQQNEILVLDVGARYGLHPTWKNFHAPAKFVLVEADPEECQRLQLRYKDRPSIEIHQIALGSHNGSVDLLIRGNPAMSGLLNRNSRSPLYINARAAQEDVVKSVQVELMTLDTFQQATGHDFDFLKLDTEGNEYSILEGFQDLSKVIGVRSEVSFDEVFDSAIDGNREGTFSRIHGRLRREGFVLLNLDYIGRGDFYSSMLRSDERYGVLQSTDAVWIKDPRELAERAESIVILKAAIFLFRNNASDVALWLLENANADLTHPAGDLELILDCARSETIRHLYQLKWIPGQDIRDHAKWFEQVFGVDYPVMNEFNDDPTFNPLDVP